MAPKDMMTGSACICCYAACDMTDIKILCVEEGEQLCCFMKGCFAAGEPVLGPGMIEADKEKGEMCNLGLGCCSIGLKSPKVLCKGESHCLCIKQAASFPFDNDYVPNCVCAYGCLQCAPECGCCKSPYSKAWLEEYEKKQGGAPAGGAPAVELTDLGVDGAKVEEMER